MSVDKSWIMMNNRRNTEYMTGLNAFVERCKNYTNHLGEARCPCKKCVNFSYFHPSIIRTHIHQWGFSTNYQRWIYHGEPFAPSPVLPVTPQTTHPLHDIINDVRQENVSQNEPMNTTQTPTATNDELEELLKIADTELYPGCNWMSSLDFLAKLSHMKAFNKWTDTSFTQLLSLLIAAFPLAKIPKSHYDAKRIMRKVGLGYTAIHVCKNDCCLFWKENIKLESCPICSESRWKDKHTKGKKVPQKVMRYFPITPRLKRMYSSRHTAKNMIWHATGRCTEDGKLRHPVDGTSWKEFDARYPDFAAEPRNVRLALSADGFNPFGNMSTSYSMWPVILTTYNLPPWLCMKESSFMLALLIPGPKSPGKDMDVFLRPLVDELKTLWSPGVVTKDAVTNTVFTMRGMLMWTISDFPARSSLSGWSGQGYLACPTCNVDTPSVGVLGKTAYVGHRRWLPANHKWRKDKSFNGENETRRPPIRKTKDELLRQLNNLSPSIPGKHVEFGGKKRKRDSTVDLNWTKRSIFQELEYFPYLDLQHNLDVMHTEKNVCESLLNTLMMNKEKSKDTDKARMVLKQWNIRPELWLVENGQGKFTKPQAKYSFSTVDRKLFCQFIKGVKLPDGFGSNFKHKVTDNDTKIAGMKSHDHHIMMQRLLPIGVRAYLDTSISTPIIELSLFFKQLCARNLMISDMQDAEEKLIKILCSFEQIFPPSFFDIMIHLVMHLPEEAIKGGPVYMRWMYPFERYMKKLKNYVRNKARPEGCIAEGYVADEALTFCSRYLKGVPTRFNRLDRNADAPVPAREFHVFESICTPVSKGVNRNLDHELKKKLDWYILNNSPEIEEYKNEFTAEMPNGTQLQTEFAGWFKLKISRMRANNESSVSIQLFALAHGPLYAKSYTTCIVNGVRFVVYHRDIRRTTQNSGIATTGIDGIKYYGVLEDILELEYIGRCKVVLFRCKWFKTNNIKLCVTKNNITSISTQHEWFKNDQYILATQANQVFYLDEPCKANQRVQSNNYWKVVQEVNNRKLWDRDIVNEYNQLDVIHGSTSSNLSLSANLEDFTYNTLSGEETTEVNVPLEDVDADEQEYEDDASDESDADDIDAIQDDASDESDADDVNVAEYISDESD